MEKQQPPQEPQPVGHVLEAILEQTINLGNRLDAEKSALDVVLGGMAKARTGDNSAASAQRTGSMGRIPHPVDYHSLKRMKFLHGAHGRALQTKATSLTGFGFKSPDVAKKLDPLCETTFYDLMRVISQEIADCHTAYMEVARDGSNTALFHLPTERVHVYVRDRERNCHFEYEGDDGATTVFAPFGQLEKTRAWLKERSGGEQSAGEAEKLHEVIQFKVPNNWSPHYGVPDYLPVLPKVEISQVIDQFNFDFFQNWGSVAHMLLLHGDSIDDNTWQTIQKEYKKTLQNGRGFKGILANIPAKDLKVDKVELGSGQHEGHFLQYQQQQNVDVTSGHAVPFPIALIQPSEKMVFPKTDETRDSVRMFQAIWAGPMQMMIAETLGATLGQEITIKPAKRVSQEITGVTQELKEEDELPFMPKSLEEALDFNMAPMEGGPDDGKGLGQQQGAPAPGSEGTNGADQSG